MTSTNTGTDWLKKQAHKMSDDHILPVSTARAAAVEVESWLQARGVRYSPPAMIPMSLIDEKRSRANQARREPLVADSVDRFTTAVKSGSEFPPIVVVPTTTKVWIIDGNNRHEGHKKAKAEQIYGITIDPETPGDLIQLLTVEANAHHGVTPPLDWRLTQAFGLIDLGFTDQEAADAAAVTAREVKTARALAEVDARAKVLKITLFPNLPAGSRTLLGGIKDEAVFYQAALVAMNTGMTIDDIRDMLRLVKLETSEASRIEVIGNIFDERKIQAQTLKVHGRVPGRVGSPKQSLVTGIGKLLNVDPAALARQVVTLHDKTAIELKLKELESKLLDLQVAMEQVKVDDE